MCFAFFSPEEGLCYNRCRCRELKCQALFCEKLEKKILKFDVLILKFSMLKDIIMNWRLNSTLYDFQDELKRIK